MLNRITTTFARLWCRLYLRVRFIQATRSPARPAVYVESRQNRADGSGH